MTIAISTIFIVIGILLFALTLSLFLFHKDLKHIPKQFFSIIKKLDRSKQLKECTIEEIASRIATESLNELELLQVVNMVAKNHRFPRKDSTLKPDAHIKFIYKFCFNNSANNPIIQKMSSTLKTINKTYKKEIEDTKKMAVQKLEKTSKK